MSYGTRIAAVLFGLTLGLATSGLAHASTLGPTSPAGTYTYNISLGNGASLTLTQSGPLGQVGTSTLSTNFNGTPVDGYLVVPGGQSGTGDNATWTELQFQYAEPTSPGSNTAASILSYTITESDSFWAQTGETLFPADGVTTYGGLLYLNLNMDGSFVDPDDTAADFIGGTVNQGAWFDTYTPSGPQPTDPPCTSCSVTVTFTPAVSAVPEPSTMTLLGTGMAAIIGVYRRRRLS
jgi:PEP-CTERM motif